MPHVRPSLGLAYDEGGSGRPLSFSGENYATLRIQHPRRSRKIRAKELPMPGKVSVRLAVTLLAAAGIAGCTTTTPYQPYRPHSAGGIHGGYSDQQLAPDRYLVRFHGNSLTSRDRVEGYMLYRAAQLTVQSGFDWFLVLDRNTEHNVRTIVRPDPFYRPWYGQAYGAWRPYWDVYIPGPGWRSWDANRSWNEQFDVRRIEAFETTAEIQMRRAPVPPDAPRAIDARKVLAELGPRIELPKH